MKKLNNTYGRLEWLDVAKAITILLMIAGHSALPSFISNFIWVFHMPLFFIASGLTTNWGKHTFREFSIRKVRSLLLPFAFYSIIILSIQYFLGWNTPLEWLKNGWQGYALWFIPVLFLALIISKVIMAISCKSARIVVWLAMAILGGTLSYFEYILPWAISSVPFAVVLIILGSYTKSFVGLFSSPKWWILIGGFIITIAISHFWHLDMAWNIITPILPLTLGICAGTALIFTISEYIDRFYKRVSYILQSVGRETYLILAFSQIIILLINQYLSLNVVVKYLILVVFLILLKYLKNGFAKLINFKLL